MVKLDYKKYPLEQLQKLIINSNSLKLSEEDNLKFIEAQIDIKKEMEITESDSQYFTNIFKLSIDDRREQLNKLNIIAKKDSSSDYSVELTEQTIYVKQDSVNWIKRIIDIVSTRLLKVIESNNVKNKASMLLIWYKQLGDFQRQMIEFEPRKKEYLKSAKDAQEKGLEQTGGIAEVDINMLQLKNNYSVFLQQNMKEKEKAIQIAQECKVLFSESDYTSTNTEQLKYIFANITQNLKNWKKE